ncbi:hypothetical protein [Paenibacillus macquariensis]|uniref:CxxH/CxxC protein, BA_5709 family n=1 Tax=Paenibacillus macquariensis TaxID=948756 RepID=A0ABY1KH08_9BACL|nr:hypothetical protein [Paenibacillus macquariensis]OAB29589.1 hypothetical protein PMSM_23685 [Paenibacillus macquariensis subsp. macquariensis]SIR73098.1 hypothetical protein SAMN05421578_1505 [Paenibacillus macquariensis]
MKHSVVSSCDYMDCTYSKITFVLDATSSEAAFETANVLNRESTKICPICGQLLGYFPSDEDDPEK